MKLKRTLGDILVPILKIIFVICALAVAVWLIPLIMVAFTVFTELTVTILVLLLSLRVFFVARKLYRRRRFLRALEAFCRGRGGRLTQTGHPYLNVLFHTRAGAEMEYKDKTVPLYFLSPKRKGTPVCIKADGSAVYFHSIRLRGVVLFSWQHIWRFCDEPKEGSFLLLMPPPKTAYAEHMTSNAQLDNGSVAGPFQVYTGGAFLRYLERST